MTFIEAQRILGINPYGEDMSFIYTVLIIFVFFIFLITLKFSKNKNVLKKSPKIYSLKKTSSINFWNGHKGLPLTFWGFFVGGNILLNTLTMIFADNPTLIMINLIFFIIWNLLSVMGVFNAANIYKAEKIRKRSPYIAASIAKVAVVLLILSAVGNNIIR